MLNVIVALVIGVQGPVTKLEILGSKFERKMLYAHVVSPDGKNIVCRYRNGDESGQVAFLRGDDVEPVSLIDGWSRTDCVAVSNQGQALMDVFTDLSYHEKSKGRSFSIGYTFGRSYLYENGSVTWLIDDPDTRHGFVATGFSSNGRIVGIDVPKIAADMVEGYGGGRSIVEIDGKGVREVFYNSSQSGVGPKLYNDYTAGGSSSTYVGRIVENYRDLPTHGFFINHAVRFRDGRAELLEPSRRMQNTDAFSATADGRTIAGSIDDYANVWRDGKQLRMAQGPADRKNLAIRSFNEDGTFGVGGGTKWVNPRAIYWTEENGFKLLEAYLREKHVEIPEGWTLIDAVYVSPDGRTIIGSASDKKNVIRPFKVELPKKKS